MSTDNSESQIVLWIVKRMEYPSGCWIIGLLFIGVVLYSEA